jgi:HlyD family secretion protein
MSIFGRIYGAIGHRIDRMFGGVPAEPGTSEAALAQGFKPDATAIEEAPIPISAYSALYVVLAVLIAGITWSILGQVDRIVIAQGKIVTTAPVIVMQPFTTSRIAKLHVKAGDRVKKGQTLVSFDPAFAQADQTSLEQKVRALKAEIDRINAELSGQEFALGAKADNERRTQAQLFAQRVAQFEAEMTVRDSRERQVDAQIDSDNKSIEGLNRQLELAKGVTNIRRQLQEKQLGSTIQLMAAQKEEEDIDLRLKNTASDREKLNQQKAEILAERQSFLDHWHGDLNQRLSDARKEEAQAIEELNKANKLKDFTELTSPVDAVVLELADRSEGSVLREAETLITLVPDDAELNLEADILSRDVGFVTLGDPVRVKLEAYPFQQYGTLDGKLDVLSPDSLPVKEGERTNVVFRGEIHLRETAGSAAGHGIKLRPGLVATAEIKAGQRSIASYILDPVIQTTDESLREP